MKLIDIMPKEKNLNLACGNSIIISDDWINIDFITESKSVIKCNILKGLPFKECSIANIYTSHFIEHVPLNKIKFLLNDLYKVLVPGGILRIVTPDFNEICDTYLKLINQKNLDEARFVKIELLDQLVRLKQGGLLGKKLRSFSRNNNLKMLEFANRRIGYNKNQKFENLKKNTKFYKISKFIRQKYINTILNFLPSSFKDSNISYTEHAEKHTWVWDYDELKNELTKYGFINIRKKNFRESDILNFKFELDVMDNKPRKGTQSMFVEAQKKKD